MKTSHMGQYSTGVECPDTTFASKMCQNKETKICSRSDQFSTIQAAVTTVLYCTEQSNCVCRQQQRTDIECKRAILSLKITTMKRPSFLLAKLQSAMLLFLLLLFQCTVTQIHSQEDSVPIRCLTDAGRCEFSISWQYYYDRESQQCEHILCLPLPDGADSVNRFSSLEECESICLTIPVTTELPMTEEPVTEEPMTEEPVTPEPVTDLPEDNASACFIERHNVSSCVPDFPFFKYYFESSSNECLPYESVNCEADGVNSFRTQQECEQLCVRPVVHFTTSTSGGSGDKTTVEFVETTFAPDVESTAITPDDGSTVHDTSNQPTTTTTQDSTTSAVSTAASRPPTISLNIFDYAIVGVAMLALCLFVLLGVLIVVIYKYRTRLSLGKQDVMDSQRIRTEQAYRVKGILYSDSLTSSSSLQTHSYVSTV